MKNLSKLFVMLLFVGITASCKKERCTTCYITSSVPGASQSKSFCGTEQEISQESSRLYNSASKLNADLPGTYNTGGCY